jgi:CBS domain-containing membrane protein
VTPTIRTYLLRFKPARTGINTRERLRALCGVLLGLGLTAALSSRFIGPEASALWLMAPMGASAVLLFVVPASPLAQPWSIIGGNVVAAAVGVASAHVIAQPFVAATLACALAIAAMFSLRCLHPPSGAVAMTAVLGGPAIHALGYGFVLTPILLNGVILLGAALLFNTLTGRRYPHSQQAKVENPHLTRDVAPTARLGFTSSDLEEVLKRYNQVLDVSRDDLESILLQTEMRAHQRRLGEVRCADIMSRDVVSVEYGTAIDEAWILLGRHHINAMPVTDSARHVIGIVTRADFLRHADLQVYDEIRARFHRFLQRSGLTHTEKQEVVGQIMQPRVVLAVDTQPIVEMVPLMSDQGIRQVPVIDHMRRLVGMITQTDMIASLFEAGLHAQTGAPGVAPAGAVLVGVPN